MKFAAALVSTAFTLFASSEGSAPLSPDVRPVRTVVAATRAEGEPVSLTGHIRARTEESLAFRIDGRMIARRVDVGQVVKQATSSPNSTRSRSRTPCVPRRPSSAAAQAAFHEAANNLERQRTLVRQGWSTRVQFDATEKAFLSAKAEVDATRPELHSTEDQLGYTKLLADSSGAVIATGAEAGEVVRAGQMIVTVAHDDGADAVFDVPASLMRQVSPDALISIALTDDPTVHTVGRVREVAPQADPVTRSYRVKVGLTDWPKAMRLGATVTGQTRMLAPGGIELPATALTIVDNKPAVWVVDPDNSGCLAATRRAATPGFYQHRRDARARRRRSRRDRRRACLATRPEGPSAWGAHNEPLQSFRLGDHASFDRLLPDAGARRPRHRLLLATGPQRGSHLHHQDHGGAGAMAGRDAGRHAASGHRTDRAQAAGDASPRLPEELHQGGPIDGLRVSEGIDRAEGGVGYLVSGSQEGARHRTDPAAGCDRSCRRRRVRRHLRHRLWLYRGRVHESRAARLCGGYPFAAVAGARRRQGEPDRRPARAHLHRILAREAGRLRPDACGPDGGAAGAERRGPLR